MLNPSDTPPEQQGCLKRLQKLVDNHPIVLWTGIGTTLVLVSSVAVVNLLNPGPIEPEASLPSPTLSTIQQSVAEPQPVQEPVRQSTLKKELPLSLFGAIAIGCAAGSLLVTQTLRQSNQRRHPSKRLKPSTSARKKQQPPSKGEPPVPRTPQPTHQTLTDQLATTHNPLAQVTVMPVEHNHPLDGGNENLAEMMDLRKRHSLASLMRGR